MPAIEIRPDVYWIGVNDRTTDLFEGIWPISQEGVSYNAYLIKDKKNVIIDLAKAFKTDEFFDQISEKMEITDLNYVVMNHIEPDHSGVITTLLKIVPKLKIICSEKCKEMLKCFYGITKNVQVVKDGETLSIGKRTLKFVMTPFVHWPETMMTYDETHNILFSCDAFGSYGAFRGTIFDDQVTNPEFFKKEALRYFVNIVSKFSGPTLKAIEKLKEYEIKIIAPSHGLIWRSNPEEILDFYKAWSLYATNPSPPSVTFLYASMYGNTEKVMNAVAQGISKAGVAFEIFDVARTHVSYILPSLWTRSAVMIGVPTYEGNMFPPMVDVLNMAMVKRIYNKKVAIFGSYGWSGGCQRNLEKRFEPLKWELMDQFEFCGAATNEELEKGIEFGEKFANGI